MVATERDLESLMKRLETAGPSGLPSLGLDFAAVSTLSVRGWVEKRGTVVVLTALGRRQLTGLVPQVGGWLRTADSTHPAAEQSPPPGQLWT